MGVSNVDDIPDVILINLPEGILMLGIIKG